MWSLRPNRRNSSRVAAPALAAALLVAASFFTAGEAAAQGGTKIGVVNLDAIVAQSPAGKALQAKLEQFQQQARAEGEAKAVSAREIRQRIADGANSLSEDKLAQLQQEWEDAQIAIRRLNDDKQREGRKMQEAGLKKIEEELEPVFKKIRDEGGFDLILNNVPGVVVMISQRVDLTDQVIAALQAGGSGAAGESDSGN